MANKVRDLTGLKFGKLSVLSLEGSDSSGRKLWNCICDCGNNITKRSAALIRGQSKSCGCLPAESARTNMLNRTNTNTKKEAIEARIEIDKVSGCWNWIGSHDKDGYGKIQWRGKNIRAHRMSYALKHGDLSIVGKFVCHHCDNPNCVNPDHLFVGDPKDNSIDARNKLRAYVGEKNTRAKLKIKQVNEIRKSSLSSSVLAKQYGVSKTAIKRIKNGSGWNYEA